MGQHHLGFLLLSYDRSGMFYVYPRLIDTFLPQFGATFSYTAGVVDISPRLTAARSSLSKPSHNVSHSQTQHQPKAIQALLK